MENLMKMKECLISAAETQISGNLEKVNAEELGEVIDMIKDLSEAVYYCTVTEAMEQQEKTDHGTAYYKPQHIEYYDPRYRERYPRDTMYAQGGGRGGASSSNGGGGGRGASNYTMYNDGTMYHDDMMYPEMGYIYRDGMMKDPREGRSGMRRKMYMEGKGYKDKIKQMQDLESYMQDLATDMTEMIQDASPEEKQLLQQKLTTLAQKVK